MSSKRTAAFSTANIDTAAANELFNLSDIGVYGDLLPLVDFIEKNFLTRTLRNLIYFSAVNDFSKLSQNAKSLANVLEVINFILHEAEISSDSSLQAQAKLAFLENKDRIVEFYGNVLENLKIFYKVFGARRPPAIVPLMRILLALVNYKNHNLFSELIEHFEFSHSSVYKLLIPTRDDFDRKIIVEDSMRFSFISFYLGVAARATASLRKSMLTNFKVMNNFWKYLEMDRFELLGTIFTFLYDSVLNEPLLKRTSKCQIFNENFLYKMSTIFNYVQSQSNRLGDEDEEDFSNFKESFTKLMETLVSDQSKGITFPQNESGSPLEIDEKVFMVNNKLIFTLITALKPWESYVQLQFVLTVLKNNNELLPPYMSWMVSRSGGYHDPMLSSYWMGHTLLYSEILKLEGLPLKPEFISLQPLSPTSLIACLSFNFDLIKQLSLQLILLQLNRVSNSHNPPQALVESVLSNLPPQASYIPLLTHSNNIIRLTSTIIVNKYEALAPSSSSAAVVNVIKENLASLDVESCNALELLLVDNYLAIQSNNDFKWWTKSSNGASFFVSLLKLSNISFLQPKILGILNNLLESTLTFHSERLIDHPVSILIEVSSKIIKSRSAAKLWSCLDETIARCIKAPYKYLDRSHNEFSDLSVFYVVLFEQIRFVPGIENDNDILNWLSELMTNAITLGEPKDAILEICKKSLLKIDVKTSTQTRPKITSKLRFLEHLIDFNCSVIKSEKESTIIEKFTKLGNFLMSAGLSDTLLFRFVTNPDRWVFLSLLKENKELKESQAIAVILFAELFLQFECNFETTKLNKTVHEICCQRLSTRNQKLVSKLLWILDLKQLQELAFLSYNNELVVSVLKSTLERKISITPDFEKLMDIDNDEVGLILSEFLIPLNQIVGIIERPKFHFLLEKNSHEVVQYILEHPEVGDDVLYRVAGCSPTIVPQFAKRVIPLALSMRNWIWSIRIFSAKPEMFDLAQVSTRCFAVLKEDPKAGFYPEFAELIQALFRTDADSAQKSIEQIKVWFQKSMLYITKKLSDNNHLLSKGFTLFLQKIGQSFHTMRAPWDLAPAALLNSQLEVILGDETWVTDERLLQYTAELIYNEKSKKSGSAAKLLQIMLNNEALALLTIPDGKQSRLRILTALIIDGLYRLCSPKDSTRSLMLQVLGLYQGSTRAEDIILKNVLKAVEANVSQSWMSYVTNWDFSEMLSNRDLELVGEEPLIIKDKSSLVVALNKKFINNSLKEEESPLYIDTGKGLDSILKFADSFPSGSYQTTTYDPEFLILAVLNNDELVTEKDSGMTFNFHLLVESGILQFVVNSLAIDSVHNICKVILLGMLKYIQIPESPVKEKNVLQIYLSSILHTLRVADHSIPLVWHLTGSLVPIITNHNHFLYDKAIHYVLTNPTYRETDIPLYYSIVTCSDDDNIFQQDNYYRQVAWLIEHLSTGIKSIKDLKLVKSRGVVEWALNLANAKYVSTSLRSKILMIMYKIQEMGYEGSDMLMTKLAGLSTLEVMNRDVDTLLSDKSCFALNIGQIGLRFGILGNTKRLRDWTHDDVSNSVKRLHV